LDEFSGDLLGGGKNSLKNMAIYFALKNGRLFLLVKFCFGRS